MMLWEDVGGRTWTERAGPRTAVAEADARPRLRRRLRRVAGARSSPTTAGPRVSAPDGGAQQGPR